MVFGRTGTSRATSITGAATLLLILLLVLAPARTQAREAVESGTARVDGADLAWQSQGSGDPLLLVGGYGCTLDIWPSALVEDLAGKRRVITYDHRGIGSSSLGGREVTLARLAADAAGLLEALGVERADVLGWSMGGMAALELALAHPERVQKLVLYATDYDSSQVMDLFVNPAGAADKTPAEKRLLRLFPAPWLAARPEFPAGLPRPACPPDRAALSRQYRAIRDWPGVWERLPAVAAPTLVVVGELDVVTPPDRSLDLVGRIPGAWLARFRGGGHGLMYQAPHELARLVETFLELRQDLK